MLCIVLLGSVASASHGASTGSSVVGATVPGSTSVANTCITTTARSFGSVTVGSNSLTATGPTVCRFGFGSSNGFATARIAQRDRLGVAMQKADSASATSRAADPGYQSIDVVDALRAFAGRSDGQILRTGDDGGTWAVENSGTPLPILAISAIDTTNAYAVANCGIGCPTILKRTTAGGTTWAAQSPPGGFLVPVSDVAHLPGTPDTAVIVGWGGAILRTTDGGANWATVASGTANTLRGVRFFDSTLAYAVGNAGTVLRSTDAGASWNPVASGTAADIVGLDIAPGPTLFFATATAVYRSTNPAVATPTITNIGGLAGSCSMVAISAPTASTVFVTGNYTCNVARSTDANVATPTWARTTAYGIGTGNDIDATSATHAMSAIGTGAIDLTTDGFTWNSVRAASLPAARIRSDSSVPSTARAS